MVTDESVSVVSSFSSPLPQIQPSEGAAAQTPLAASCGVLARAGAQAGIGVGDGGIRSHVAGGCSGACTPCVRHTSMTISESMSCSSDAAATKPKLKLKWQQQHTGIFLELSSDFVAPEPLAFSLNWFEIMF